MGIMGIVCSTHGKDMTSLQNFGQNTSSEETTCGTGGGETPLKLMLKNCALRRRLVRLG